jgi:hypothetical protein
MHIRIVAKLMPVSGKSAEDAKAQRPQRFNTPGFMIQTLCVLCAFARFALFAEGKRI